MKNIYVLIIFSYFNIYAQDEPLITDRPDVTESAITVPLNSIQIETGFVLQNSKDGGEIFESNTWQFTFFSTLARYGLFENIELRLAAEYIYQKISSIENVDLEGLNALTLGTKIQLVKNKISFPDAALIIHFNLPVGNENFKPEKVEPEAIFTFANDLDERFSLSYNLGGSWISSEEKLYYLYSAALGASLSDKIGVFLEFFGEAADGIPFGKNFDAGITYLLQNNFQVDLSAGVSMDEPTSNWFISTGVSFRLPE